MQFHAAVLPCTSCDDDVRKILKYCNNWHREGPKREKASVQHRNETEVHWKPLPRKLDGRMIQVVDDTKPGTQ